jgi:Ran GTPase-activating protein (RanGAP) involved in mRNA processing and transport
VSSRFPLLSAVVSGLASVSKAPVKLHRLRLRDERQTSSAFAAALKADSSVRRLELDDNALGTAGLLKIAEAIGARNVDLLSLQITSNAIGDEGVEALADFLGRSSALRTLKLGGNGLSDAAAAILADVIPPSLHELDLSNNNIGDNGFLSLLHACADTLVGCGHSKCGPGHDTTFSTRASSFIPFDNNAITSRGARDAASLLRDSNDKLRELDLKGNAIDVEAVNALFHVGDQRRAAGRTLKVKSTFSNFHMQCVLRCVFSNCSCFSSNV